LEEEEEEMFCSKVVVEEITWLWFPQTRTFVGKAGAGDSCSTCTTKVEEGVVLGVASAILQRGQVEWDWNHISMQSI
jgi:hypothetical protein